ncbi:MAG TPA: hypothetical protein VIV60_24905, partial [Polyangiaceae bacterium]
NVTRVLLPGEFTRMEAHNAITYETDYGYVVPAWHPLAAISSTGEGKDPLAWLGDAILHFKHGTNRRPQPLSIPNWEWHGWGTGIRPQKDGSLVVAVDTEGLPEDPICMTWSDGVKRCGVEPRDVPLFFERLRAPQCKLIFHNAPWDWKVIEAMGVPDISTAFDFDDTMELAYLKQTEPQGLKELLYRYFGLKMKSFEDVVMPVYYELARTAAEGIVRKGTTITTHSEKTGKAFKKPKVQMTEEVKPLHRAMNNPELLVKRLEGFIEPTLRIVPFNEFAEYATLDAYATMKLWQQWRLR